MRTMKIFLRNKLHSASSGMLISGLFFLLFFAIIANMAMAQGISIPNPLGSGGKDIPTLIGKIANWLLGIGTVISTIIVLWSALLFMTSGGNPNRVTQARQTLWYAIIGLAILLLADGVSLLIQNFLKGNF